MESVSPSPSVTIVVAVKPRAARSERTALRALSSNYEQLADLNWRLVCHAQDQSAITDAIELAHQMHRAWLEGVFADYLPKRGRERERRIALLFTATDFYVWKLHRRDFGRSAVETEAIISQLVHALIAAFQGQDST